MQHRNSCVSQLFMVFFVFWFIVTKCCCRPTPGVAYTQIAKIDAGDDIDNDLEVGNIRPDKSPRVRELQRASPPVSRESSVEVQDMNRGTKDPRYTDDESGEVRYSDDVGIDNNGAEEDDGASDESYNDEEGIRDVEQVNRPASLPVPSSPPSSTSSSTDHQGVMERSNPKQPPLHIASKKKYDNDDKYTKKNRDQRGHGAACLLQRIGGCQQRPLSRELPQNSCRYEESCRAPPA